MTVADKQHRLRKELLNVQKDMAGINKSTETYQKLEKKRSEILLELEQLGAQRTKV